jgi:putative oxidoreductase
MKSLFKTSFSIYYMDVLLLLVRILVSCYMFSHGVPKLEKLFSDDPVKFADPIGIGMTTSLVLVVFAEVFCSIFVMIGLGTRLAVIPLLITMAVAAFLAHSGASFAEREASLLYMLIYMILFITGSGKFSVDKVLTRRLYR